jgi:hypothetical protein
LPAIPARARAQEVLQRRYAEDGPPEALRPLVR